LTKSALTALKQPWKDRNQVFPAKDFLTLWTARSPCD